jgi:hypothetical protein
VCSAASARSAVVNALALSTRISAAHAGLAKPMPSAVSKLQTAVVVKGGKRMEPSIIGKDSLESVSALERQRHRSAHVL